jgi:hypothetical protein
VSDVELTQAMAELREVVRCRCDEAYRDRGLKDPHCECDSADAVKVVADRIKALEAKLATCEKYRDAYAEMGRIGTQAVRDLETKLAAAEAEAKKYKHAFAAQSRKLQAVLHIEGVKATLAEIKGGNDAKSDL